MYWPDHLCKKQTGGRGYEGFAGNNKTERHTNDEGQSCYSCHLSQKENDFIFSKYRN
ncbi:MAG: cytochrome P460 family protein [Thermodesulfobacteriota bacterium]